MPDKEQTNREIKLKKGRMARRQARLRDEGQQMILGNAGMQSIRQQTKRLALEVASRDEGWDIPMDSIYTTQYSTRSCVAVLADQYHNIN
ncbi:hypothetical protein Vi05172_g7113 [Venturia inaequalis]|nr:hypothetical protein Vi05172_g7113 [Venturia inaequalis]